ncbi:hypothetical protein K8I31_02490 [bacterium]|nr:hypothetical protein [bacterium]
MIQRTLYIILLLIPLALFSWADRITPLSLTEITTSAATVFEGECIEVRSGVDSESGMLATWYTFKVAEGIKGDVGETFTFKQYGGSDGERTVVSPSVKYEKGQKVILFLYGTSKIGFSSAIGLTQGKFIIEEDPKTKQRTVSNGMPAAVLFKNAATLPASYDSQGRLLQGTRRLQGKHLDRDDFVATVKELIESASKETKKNDR